jgi:DNA-binding transcriptional regulator YdaS (Cro superfamily)
MDLYEYKWRNKIPMTKIAKDLNASAGYLNRVAAKKQKIGFHLAKRLEEYTKGQVTVEELMAPPEKKET